MSRLRKLLRKSHGTVGLQLALAMMLPAKSKAGAHAKEKPEPQESQPKPHASVEAPPHLTGRWDFSRLFEVAAHPEIIKASDNSAQAVQRVARSAIQFATAAAKVTQNGNKSGSFHPDPMSHEEIRLWLQSFNAGPYACLKYRGDVPYKETQDYVPRVMKAYEENLPSTYDKLVYESATKYGLDPQMVKAIIKTESDFQNDTVSHAGARGLMQVMPVVWSEIKDKYNLQWEYSSGVFDPQKNIEVACAYLAWLRYDFLPRHFEAYEKNPDAPVCLVRDRDRGVPDRPGPRIVARSAGGPEVPVTEIASAEEAPSKMPASAIVEESSKDEKKAEPEKKSSKRSDENPEVEKSPSKTKAKVEITDADVDKIVKKSTSKGKTRVVMRGGNGKAVALEVEKGKASSSHQESKTDSDKAELEKAKRPSVAKATVKEKEDQGG